MNQIINEHKLAKGIILCEVAPKDLFISIKRLSVSHTETLHGKKIKTFQPSFLMVKLHFYRTHILLISISMRNQKGISLFTRRQFFFFSELFTRHYVGFDCMGKFFIPSLSSFCRMILCIQRDTESRSLLLFFNF